MGTDAENKSTGLKQSHATEPPCSDRKRVEVMTVKRENTNGAPEEQHSDWYISIDETAERLGCAAKTVRNKISLGLITRQHGLRHFGRRVLIDWSLLKAALDDGESFEPPHRPKKGMDDAFRR